MWGETRAKRANREFGRPVKAEPVGKCWCGCDEPTKSGKFFVATHDSKALAALVKVEYGNIADMLASHGYSPDNSVVEARERTRK